MSLKTTAEFFISEFKYITLYKLLNYFVKLYADILIYSVMLHKYIQHIDVNSPFT